MNWDKIADILVDTFLYVSSIIIFFVIVVAIAFYIGSKFFNV